MKEKDVQLAASLYKERNDLLSQMEVVEATEYVIVCGPRGQFRFGSEDQAELQAAKFAIIVLYQERLRKVNDKIYKL
jgi:hypothetical protein